MYLCKLQSRSLTYRLFYAIANRLSSKTAATASDARLMRAAFFSGPVIVGLIAVSIALDLQIVAGVLMLSFFLGGLIIATLCEPTEVNVWHYVYAGLCLVLLTLIALFDFIFILGPLAFGWLA